MSPVRAAGTPPPQGLRTDLPGLLGAAADYRAAFGRTTRAAGHRGFFRDRVDHGFAQLNDFIALLRQALDEGQKVELVVRGFASPLAKSDYNRNLSLRRIQSTHRLPGPGGRRCVEPYLDGSAANGGRLTVVKAPFGGPLGGRGETTCWRTCRTACTAYAASERRIGIEQVL